MNLIYNIMENFLIYNRKEICELPEYIVKYGYHQNLINIIREMEFDNEHPIKLSYIHNLLLGKIGYEHNKQMAIYELPTIELLELISKIVIMFDITELEEVMAGLGLLSQTLELYFKKEDIYCDVKATDGYRWIETSGEPAYFPVEKKLLLQYVIEEEYIKTNKMFVFSWIGKNCLSEDNHPNDFLIFMDKIEPPIVLLIGNASLYEYVLSKLSNEYLYCICKTDQICYRDYFNKDKYVQNSCTILLVHKDKMCIPTIDELELVLNSDDIEVETEIKQKTSHDVFYDMIGHKLLPEWCNELNEEEQHTFIELYKESEFDEIPDYIQSYDDYMFYHKLTNIPSFTNKNKFQEFKNLYNIIDTCPLDSLKQKSILPKWIFTREMAKKFVFTDYSTKEKAWKETFPKFISKFNELTSDY
jgi:hypothetical protein